MMRLVVVLVNVILIMRVDVIREYVTVMKKIRDVQVSVILILAALVILVCVLVMVTVRAVVQTVIPIQLALVIRDIVHVMGIMRDAVGTAQTLTDVCHIMFVLVMDIHQDALIATVKILVKTIAPVIVMDMFQDALVNVIQTVWLIPLVAVMGTMQVVLIAILIMNVNVILSVQIVQQIMVNEL